jgi:hypothetical protein
VKLKELNSLKKIKSLEDALNESKNHLENSYNHKSELSFDKITTSPSHAVSFSRIMFVKPSMFKNQTHVDSGDKGKSINMLDHKEFESKIPVKK